MTTRTLSVHESLLVGFVSIAVILNAEYLVDVLKCARYNSSSVMVPRLMLRLLSLSECKSHLDWPNFNGMVGLALVNYSTALDIIFSTTRMVFYSYLGRSCVGRLLEFFISIVNYSCDSYRFSNISALLY